MARAPRVIRILGPWAQLHRAESYILASLFSAEERAAGFSRVEYGAVVLEWDGVVSRRIC